MATKASRRERRARLLGVVTLGAVVALSVTYLIAPRFSEPSQIMQSAVDELDRKILINEEVALLQGQEESIDKIVEDIEGTTEALPEPGRGDSDRELKSSIESLLNQIGLSNNALLTFSTPSRPSQWTAVNAPTEVYDPSKATGATAESGGDDIDLNAPMYQKSLLITVQGPQDRILQVVRRLPTLERAIVIDKFSINKKEEFSDPVLAVEARIFLMPSFESPLLEEEEGDSEIDEVDTPFGENAGSEQTDSDTDTDGTPVSDTDETSDQ